MKGYIGDPIGTKYPYIRHRAARHARACSGHPSGGLKSDVLRGPQLQDRVLLHSMFSSLFTPFFQTCFLPQLVPKGAKLGASKEHKIAQIYKTTPHQNASPISACKKTPSGRGQTSEFDDGYTLSAVFSGA